MWRMESGRGRCRTRNPGRVRAKRAATLHGDRGAGVCGQSRGEARLARTHQRVHYSSTLPSPYTRTMLWNHPTHCLRALAMPRGIIKQVGLP